MASAYGYRVSRRKVRSATGGTVYRYKVTVRAPGQRSRVLHDRLASRDQAVKWGRAWVKLARKRPR